MEKSELDEKVFAIVEAAPTGIKFDAIADKLNITRKRDDDKLRRSVDKSLQRLRKNSRIIYAGQAVGWKVVN